jgi:hypothetical protein
MDALTLLRSGRLKGAKRLDLSCNLTRFPEEIYDLADTLEILNLSGNELSSLPDDLARLSKLKVIFCSDNRFAHVPEVLGECESLEMVGFKANRIKHLPAGSLPRKLRWLILTDNRLASVPKELGNCHRLQKLMLAGNCLQDLPPNLEGCRNLELLRISANQLARFPEWLCDMPRLAWLAFAGNPFSDAIEMTSKVKQIGWHELELQRQLGEGASGIIHKANWHAPDGVMSVAVKVFKGAVTSDGLPMSEKAACLAVGSHPNLISATGKISGHPEGKAGLVMPLVDAGYINLASPPSLESCTRDIYPEGLEFSLGTVLSIAQGIASAAAHLHEGSIMHGDLYAHNMLWNDQGDCLLGDFGAASFIDCDPMLQRIEVRAFSCLLEELLARCSEPVPDFLWDLQKNCGQQDVKARPLFVEVRKTLAQHSDRQ